MNDLELDDLYESAYQGDDAAVTLVLEAVGNDDAATRALIELLNVARIDDDEDPTKTFHNPIVGGVRDLARLEAFHELVNAFDAYHLED